MARPWLIFRCFMPERLQRMLLSNSSMESTICTPMPRICSVYPITRSRLSGKSGFPPGKAATTDQRADQLARVGVQRFQGLGLEQGQRVLGEARSAIARSRLQKAPADAAVAADTARHVNHVGPHLLALRLLVPSPSFFVFIFRLDAARRALDLRFVLLRIPLFLHGISKLALSRKSRPITQKSSQTVLSMARILDLCYFILTDWVHFTTRSK